MGDHLAALRPMSRIFLGRYAACSAAGYAGDSELSDEKTRPSVALPVFRAVFVCGPPASAWRNEPNVMLYVDCRPGWQNGRCGHSAGPASTEAVPLHLAAKSDSV